MLQHITAKKAYIRTLYLKIKKKIKVIGGTLMVNPDGHEWLLCAKWSLSPWVLEIFLNVSPCRPANSGIAKNIEAYIQKDYAKYQPQTTLYYHENGYK